MDGRVTPAPALVVFGRAPAAGAVKTRLVPFLSPLEAAGLYEAFVSDALAAWSKPGALGVPVALRVYVAPEGGAWPDRLTPAGATVHAQRGGGLGERMLRAAVESFAAGHDRVVIVGTDHPTLPPEFIAEALRQLEERFTVVLGPSDDGGYYLVGLNEVIPALFEGLRYGHSRVLAEALARASGSGARPVLLPPWYDVDTPADLRRLAADRDAGVAVGRATEAALEALAGRLRPHGGASGNDSG